jgi:hypothetical protein
MALSVKRLTTWLDAILRRTETTHPETNWNLLTAIGEAMSFPAMLAPDNDDLADDLRPPDDPGSDQG